MKKPSTALERRNKELMSQNEQLTNLLFVIKISLEKGDTTNLINHINEVLRRTVKNE